MSRGIVTIMSTSCRHHLHVGAVAESDSSGKCEFTGENIPGCETLGFSPHLCVGFLLLVLYPVRRLILRAPLCHTHNFVTHNLSHTSLSHTNTQSFTHNFVTHVCQTQLCHIHSCVTDNFVIWHGAVALCVAGVALGDIQAAFALQAWHLQRWAVSGGSWF